MHQALTAGCRLIAVVGESGIGKTRLATEVVRGGAHDMTVLWGRCSQDRLGSYLPFVEALRHVVAQADPDTLRAAFAGRGDLTRLLPELTATSRSSCRAPPRAEAGSEQRMLFEATSAFLRAWSPVVLVVEDLHWADDATLALLAYLLRDHTFPGLVTIATARPTELEPSGERLDRGMGRELEVVRIQLDGLAGKDLELLINDLVGSAAPNLLVQAVTAATDGNPFFVEEMTLHLVDSGAVTNFSGAESAQRASWLACPNGSGKRWSVDCSRCPVTRWSCCRSAP